MTPQEKDLIQAVFARLSGAMGAKDPEADAFIREQVQRMPDSPYGLVQAVVMLEAGLNQAQARLNDLQKQLDQARAGGAAGGSFLGGGSPFGGGSVPRSAPYAPQPVPGYAQQSAPGYAQQPAPGYAQQSVPGYAPQPWQQQPVMAPVQPSPWTQPTGGSSFLRNAATMAAGVAGGTLIAEGLSSMFGHHYGGGFGGGYGGDFGGGYGGPAEVVENVTVNNYYDDQRGGLDHYADNSGAQDASYDAGDSYYDGGTDDSIDI